MAEEPVLELSFLDIEKKTRKIIIKNPLPNLSKDDVLDAMDDMIDARLILANDGQPMLRYPTTAYYVKNDSQLILKNNNN